MKQTICPSPAQQKTLLCSAVLPLWARLLTTAQAQSDTAVAEMMAAFSDMTPFLDAAAKNLQAQGSPDAVDGSELAVLIERMYVGFQYQDRISQMLALLQTDMQRMLLTMTASDDVQPLDSATWLQSLESQYAMAEQRRDHLALDGSAPVDAGSDETVFF